MPPKKQPIYDAIIIGSGPAGCSCALWLKQLGFAPLIIDRNLSCGGLQLSNPWTNTWIATTGGSYGKDVAKAMDDNMARHDIELRMGQQASIAEALPSGGFRVHFGDGAFADGKVLVLATGTEPRSGGLSERLNLLIGPGTRISTESFNGAKVAILGGGDSAFENYTFVKRKGAASALIFARHVRARANLIHEVDPGDVVIGESIVDQAASTVNGHKFDKIIVLYGCQAGRGSTLGLGVALRSDGLVWTEPNCQTSLDGVFAIGEVAGRSHPCCVTAMADGVVAAKAIQARLEAGVKARLFGAIRRTAILSGQWLAGASTPAPATNGDLPHE